MGNNPIINSRLLETQDQKKSYWKKSLIVYLFLTFALMSFIVYLAYRSFTAIVIFVFIFVIISVIFSPIVLVHFYIGNKVRHLFDYVGTKFWSKRMQMGQTEKQGEILFSWSISQPAMLLRLSSKYKLLSLIFLLMIFLSFFVFEYIKKPVSNLSELIVVIPLATVVGIIFVYFTFWVASKFRIETVSYEITDKGIFISEKKMHYGFTGMFSPFEMLYPEFDDRNKIVSLRYKGRKFLRRFLVCTNENYPQVSSYIRGIYYPTPQI